MQQQASSPYQQFRTINIVYTALPVMVTLFGIIVLSISYMRPVEGEGLDILVYAAPILLVIAMPVSTMLFNNIIAKARQPDVPINKKLLAYQTGVILRAAMLEAPALLACIVAYTTGKIIVLGVVPLVLIVFFIHRPTLYRLESDLELSRDEVDQLKSKSGIS